LLKVIAQTQTHLKNVNYLTLKSKVKLRSRWNTTHRLVIIHLHTKYHWICKFTICRAITFLSLQIGQWYLVCRCIIMRGCHVPTWPHFCLWPQGQIIDIFEVIEVTMEHDTPSRDYTPTYQISLIYRKKQNSYDSDTITLQKYQLFGHGF
jgi:hypothetical protein